MLRALPSLAALALSLFTSHIAAANSQCFGGVANGRIENSVKLPVSGPNFSAYSALASGAGRTHVHSTVAEIMLAAYASLATATPATKFVYGETGWPAGGRFRPHHTHQNGLSVDFFVPVHDATGRSAVLPATVANKFGYGIEFDSNARFGDFTIDFAAMAEHLYQLDVAAKAHGAGIALVIFDTVFLPKLFATARGPYLERNLHFMKGKPWVRHDEHYHVDFAVPCNPGPARAA